MHTRVLPSLLAILILTNPICCQMFGSMGAVRSEEPVAECACQCGDTCGEGEQRDSSSDGRDVPDGPCGCPNCTLCQCVCAGAVVKDLATIDNTNCDTPIDVISETPVDVPSLLLYAASTCDDCMACGDANVGRTARVRHCSLLC